jgi:hypothetical protein
MRTTVFANEMPINPHVPMTIPAVIARSPDESRTRRRLYDHTWRGRRDRNINPNLRKSGRRGANEHRCHNSGQYQPGQTSLRSWPFDPETNDSGIHFQSTSIHEVAIGNWLP